MEKVLLYTKNVDATNTEISSIGGKVSIQLGDDLVIAKVPYGKVRSHFQTASTHVPRSASPQTLGYVNAYWKSVKAEAMEQPEILKWTDRTAPMVFHRPESPDNYNRANQISSMKGKIAVIVLIASGPGSLAMSDSEVDTIKSEVLAGLNFWENEAPNSASLSFVLLANVATITASDSTSCDPNDYSVCHNRYAIPTMRFIGFTSVKQIEEFNIKYSYATGAFVVFLTKYKQNHFAYAYSGSGPIYMQYSNGGWGPSYIDRVFAHETGHIFNAPDEYISCSCSSQYGKGSCTERNSNCKDCTNSQQRCIMDSNSLTVCPYTKKHIGWCE